MRWLAEQPGVDVSRLALLMDCPGAFQGFDSEAPVMLRSGVPNGSPTDAGVHVGGQPETSSASHAALLDFLRTAPS